MSMVKNLTINELDAKFDVVVNNDEYLALVDKFQNEEMKNVKVDGFRPGMVPKEIALKHIDAAALESLIMEKIVKETSKSAFAEVDEKLTSEGRVLLSLAYDTSDEKSIKEDDQQNLNYSCIANLLPKVDLSAVEKLKVTIDQSQTNYPEYEAFEKSQIRSLMKDANEYESSIEGAKDGDKVVMSFSGELNGEKHDELGSDQYTLLLGSNEFLPEFEAAVLGMKTDESKTFDVQFPSDYFSEKFAGKTVVFTTVIKEVNSPKYNSIQEIIESSEDKKQQLESEENIKSFIKTRYDQEKNEFEKSAKQTAVIEKIISDSPNFPISSEVVNQQTDRIFNQLLEYAQRSGQNVGKAFVAMGMKSDNKNIENADSLTIRSEIEENVKKELKLQYTYLTVIRTKKLELPSLDELKVYVDQIKASPSMYGYPETASEEELTDMIGDNLANRKALDYLIDKIAQ
jgi:trigger factor